MRALARRGLPACLLVLASACGGSQQVEAEIEVIEVSGYLDDARLEYVRESVTRAAAAGRELVILQVDSAAVIGSDDGLRKTTELVADPPLPLVAWLGPAPAVATGRVEEILAAAPELAIAPGSTTSVLGDRESPSLRQLVQDLDGEEIGGFPALRTVTADLPDDQKGVTTRPVTFTQPGLWLRFTHAGATPETAFFFLAMGLTLVAFEYFALGPGVAAGVAAVSLFLGSYGISILPTNPGAVGAVVVAVLVLTASYQRGGWLVLTGLAMALLLWAGLFFSSDPAVDVSGLGVVFTLLSVLFFFVLAMPTVGRARFSTQTIGREGLVGRRGHALKGFGPDGVVEIDGARWPATAHRAAGISEGDEILVVAVAGREVEVEKVPREI